mgnify:CR=1 FL=1
MKLINKFIFTYIKPFQVFIYMGGLANLGSTCAINSLIQMLCSNAKIREIILNHNNSSFSKELSDIFDLLYVQNKSLRPIKFVKFLYKEFASYFKFGEQIDIVELWMCLHETLSKEQGCLINIEKCVAPTFGENDKMINYCNYTISCHNSSLVSEWCDISQGITLNYIKCEKCNNIIYNFEPFILLPLDICENTNIAEMIEEYIKPCKLQGDWKCEKCNEYTSYIKINHIWKFPRILTVMIKRFDNNFKKNNREININPELNFKNKNIKYSLFSMALHYGNLNNGHYISICKQNNSYKLFDDLKVVNIDDNCLKNNKEVYMIMYEISNYLCI